MNPKQNKSPNSKSPKSKKEKKRLRRLSGSNSSPRTETENSAEEDLNALTPSEQCPIISRILESDPTPSGQHPLIVELLESENAKKEVATKTVAERTGSDSSDGGAPILKKALKSAKPSSSVEVKFDDNISSKTFTVQEGVIVPTNLSTVIASTAAVNTSGSPSPTVPEPMDITPLESEERPYISPKRKQPSPGPSDENLPLASPSKIHCIRDLSANPANAVSVLTPLKRAESDNSTTSRTTATRASSVGTESSTHPIPDVKPCSYEQNQQPSTSRFYVDYNSGDRYQHMGHNLAAKIKLIPDLYQQFLAEALIHMVLAEALAGNLTPHHKVTTEVYKREGNNQ